MVLYEGNDCLGTPYSYMDGPRIPGGASHGETRSTTRNVVSRMPQIQILRSVEEFESIGDQWNDLAMRQPRVTPSLRSEWIASWMRTYGERFSPLVIAALSGSRLVGGVAFSLSPRMVGPVPIFCELRFAGVYGVRGIYTDCLLDPGEESRVLQAMFDTVCQCGWTKLRLEHVQAESRCLGWVNRYGPARGFLLGEPHTTDCPVLHLPGDMPTLEAGMDPFFRKMLHSRDLKAPAKKHAVTCLFQVDPDTLERDIGLLYEIHTQRWNSQGRAGEFADRHRREFYLRMAREFQRDGRLVLSQVLLDGEPHVLSLGVLLEEDFFALQLACSDVGLACKAGTYHLYHLLSHLMGRVKRFHFMAGGDAYKYKWGAQKHVVYDVHVWRGVRGRIGKLMQNGKDVLRFPLKRATSPAKEARALL
ncbi:GNAT family N-acetyltransferase [Desulfolutivibrio sulfoxidireducens]|nr:GNAT family N-acetyltransferase [Desulfolutivibrio sulfoxidireducens]